MNQMPGSLANRMSDDEFEREREELRERYGDNRTEAGNRYEQELAKLFWRSGWTQEELAAKEGKSRPYIAQKLIFGRFLGFVASATSAENLPKNLSEGYFRKFWSQTDKDDNERQRFTAVWDAIVASQEEAAGNSRKPPRDFKPLRQKLGKKFADGKWHSVEAIADHLDTTVETITDMIGGAKKFRLGEFPYEIDQKPVGRSVKYRLFKTDRQVSLARLNEEFAPVIEALIAEGKKTPVTCSPGTVARLANQLMKLLKQWGE